jgi:hypothetical protein
MSRRINLANFTNCNFFFISSSYKTKQKIEPVDLKYHVPSTFSTAIVTTAYSYDRNWLICSPKKTEPPPKILTWCQTAKIHSHIKLDYCFLGVNNHTLTDFEFNLLNNPTNIEQKS